MKKILVPTDFSGNAVAAAKYAACLAKELDAALMLLHTETSQIAIAESTLVMDPDPTIITGCRQKLEEQAQQLQRDFTFSHAIEKLCRTGSLSVVLNEEIKNKQVDLVVMGTRGTTNFLGKIIGTNTAAFIKTAVCPVLIIPPNTPYRQIKRIGYAADFRSDERFFLHQLFRLSEPLQAEVYVVNIKSERQLKTLTDDQALYYIHKEFPESNLHINQIRENDVAKALQKFAEQNDIQILAVAMQDRNFLEEFFHKSISRQLALEAQVPLLALPTHPYTGQPKLNHKTYW